MSTYDKFDEFYGLPVSSEHEKNCDEGLTMHGEKNLFNDHLKANYGYFGSIDKTLSGFYVLNDEDDNYYLADIREPDGKGQIYFQDHETREICLEFDSIDDYSDFQEASSKLYMENEKKIDDEDYDEDEYYEKLEDLKESYIPKGRQSKLVVSTSELLERYQWLVWSLEQPCNYKPEKDCRFSNPLNIWESLEEIEESFETELPKLLNDTHLTIYWLLHFACFADYEKIKLVLEKTKNNKTRLYIDFANVVSKLGVTDTLEILPGFARRRSEFLLNFFYNKKNSFGKILQSFIMHDDLSIIKAYWLFQKAFDEKKEEELRDAINELSETKKSSCYIKAKDEQVQDKGIYVNELIKEFFANIDDWNNYRAPILDVYNMASDYALLNKAVDFFLKKDAYDFAFTKAAVFVYEKLNNNKKAKEYKVRAEELEGVTKLLMNLQKNEKEQTEINKIFKTVLKLERKKRGLFIDSLCIKIKKFNDTIKETFIEVLIGLDINKKIQKISNIIMEAGGGEHLIKKISSNKELDKSFKMDLFKSVIQIKESDYSGKSAEKFLAEFKMKSLKEAAILGLAKYFDERGVFDFFIKGLEEDGLHIYKKEVLSEIFTGYSDNVVIKKLNKEQSEKLINVCVNLIKKNISKNEASTAIYYFNNPLGEDLLIEKLNTESNKKLIESLYSAVRNMRSQKSKMALMERLFLEKKYFWRMSNAIGEIFDKDFHEKALNEIGKRKDIDAANLYMSTLDSFIKNSDNEKVELLGLLIDWKFTEQKDLQKLKYILLEGCSSALKNKSFNMVKEAFYIASKIKKKPYSNYLEIDRGREYKSPFEEKGELKDMLEEVLSSEMGE